jgi:RNA polymerase sigma-70 factor (ECF subfamily)
VLSIARNLCLDELRRRRRRVPQVPRLDDALEHHGADRTDEQAEQAILRDQVRAALHSLPGDQRSAIELVYYNGLTSNDVGRMLGVPAPTVRSRLRLGLLKLAGVLREGGVIGVD